MSKSHEQYKGHKARHEEEHATEAPPVKTAKEPEKKKVDEASDELLRHPLGKFVKVKATGKVGYISAYNPDNTDAPATVGIFTVSIGGAGVGVSTLSPCKLSDLEYLYDS